MKYVPTLILLVVVCCAGPVAPDSSAVNAAPMGSDVTGLVRDPYFCGKHAIIYDSLEVLSEDDLRDDSTEIAHTFDRVTRALKVLGEEQ